MASLDHKRVCLKTYSVVFTILTLLFCMGAHADNCTGLFSTQSDPPQFVTFHRSPPYLVESSVSPEKIFGAGGELLPQTYFNYISERIIGIHLAVPDSKILKQEIEWGAETAAMEAFFQFAHKIAPNKYPSPEDVQETYFDINVIYDGAYDVINGTITTFANVSHIVEFLVSIEDQDGKIELIRVIEQHQGEGGSVSILKIEFLSNKTTRMLNLMRSRRPRNRYLQ